MPVLAPITANERSRLSERLAQLNTAIFTATLQRDQQLRRSLARQRDQVAASLQQGRWRIRRAG